MIRNEEVEKEAELIANEIWQKLNTDKSMPKIESKHGGSSAAYYINEHCVRVRSNVWDKLKLAQKRLIMIHELYHAAGHSHTSYYLSSLDFISRKIYEKIWGSDLALEEFDEMLNMIVCDALT